MLATMKSSNKLAAEDETEQDPTVELWLLYFLSQHYYFRRDFSKALEYINEAIQHTPTVIELYIQKAHIYKHAGDLEKARELYNEARRLDQADRFLNVRASRYMLRVDRVEEAQQTMALFCEAGRNNEENLHDMQTMWYEVEVGEAYLRQGKFRLALKYFGYIEKHLE